MKAAILSSWLLAAGPATLDAGAPVEIPWCDSGASLFSGFACGGQRLLSAATSTAVFDVMEVVGATKSALHACVQAQRQKEPGVTGKLIMQWSVLPSGETTEISVQTEQFKSTHLATCLTGVIERWRFPQHARKSEPILFPFLF